jgi:hypothetical protein
MVIITGLTKHPLSLAIISFMWSNPSQDAKENMESDKNVMMTVKIKPTQFLKTQIISTNHTSF